ncbi:MAG: hypothetical protein ACR2P1_12670 [Pseudomonadales bacterium]
MSDNQHTIYFDGNIADGFSIGQVKKNLAKLFKSDAERIGELFSGERVALKKNIDLATAKKYHAVLLNAGALVTIDAANDASIVYDCAEQATAAKKEEQPEFGWSLAPVGSLLLRAKEKVKQAVVNIDISHLSLASVFAAEKSKAPEQVVAPDVTHLSVAPVGEQLVASRKEEEETELALDLSALSIDPPGVELGRGTDAEVEELQIDLSQYTLLELGEEITATRKMQAPTPEPPDVSHIVLMPEPEPEEENGLT